MKTIQLKDEVVVSDPCYELGTWCAAHLKGVKPGTYHVFVKKTNEGSWGVRIANMMVVHEDHLKGVLKWAHLPYDIGVDSGQCGIFSLESFRNDDHDIPLTESEFSKNYVKKEDESGEKWYVSMCDFTLSTTMWGVYDQGVVTSSGLGDGSYVLFGAKNSDGEIVALSVDYLLGEEIGGDDDEDAHISIDLNYYRGQHLMDFLRRKEEKSRSEI
jgi:hypothetical protein